MRFQSLGPRTAVRAARDFFATRSPPSVREAEVGEAIGFSYGFRLPLWRPRSLCTVLHAPGSAPACPRISGGPGCSCPGGRCGVRKGVGRMGRARRRGPRAVGMARGRWASPSRARSLVPLRICPNLPSLLSPSLFVLKPIPAPLGWGGGRVPPPPTPPGEGGAGPAGARRPPPPPPLRPAPAGSPAPRAESEADARSLIYGRPAVPGEGAPLSLGSGTWVRKRASARAAVGLDQELALSHRCPHARPPLGAPASSSGPSLPAS